MLEIARRPEKERRDLFRAAAQLMQVHEAIIEKDFWVCWVLDYLFHDSPWKEQLAFKGGTSLSKAYGAIERFSEDIDLVLDWQLLGYTSEEPWMKRSATKQDAFGKESNLRTAEFLAKKLAPIMQPALGERIKAQIGVDVQGQDVFIQYPKSFSTGAIHPRIRLEIGPMAAWIPNEQREIQCFAASYFPQLFSRATTSIRTILAERSFWEKATILHQEAHRSVEKLLPPRYSRHYYDLYRLSRTTIHEKAVSRMELLREVVEFKMRFYRCPWARYEEAIRGSIRLLPPEFHVAELRKDYFTMQSMLFGQIPSFEEIMRGLEVLEKEINDLRAAEK
jgi:hypothetical protein